MKSYTDLEQSKRLADILPLESADMHYSTWTILDGEFIVSTNQGSTIEDLQEDYGNQIIPCWSLSALLDVYPMVVGRDMDMYCCWQNSKNLHSRHYDNPIDACYEMIMKLHEQKIL